MNSFMLRSKKVLSICMETTAGGRNYSGGLGALYGDTTRTMDRLGASFIAVTPLYKNGYVRQYVDSEKVVDKFPAQNHEDDYDDTGIILSVPMLGREINVKVWHNKVMKNAYGIDSNLPENDEFAKITDNLYGEQGIAQYNGEEQRLMQEILLGAASVKLCKKIGYDFDIVHLNEGHGVFASIYMLSEYLKEGMSFEDALKHLRYKTVFTTHTPIMAGNKSRPIDMVIKLGGNFGLTYDQLKAVGAYNEHDYQFGSTVASLRVSKIANAVAMRHQPTSQDLWKEVSNACPITYIDNGVDIEFWQDKKIRSAFNDGDFNRLLEAHRINKRNLIWNIYQKNNVKLDENSIIIGFARRAIAYKRWDLIFTDIGRFEYLIKKYNVQFVFAGKTHPKDEGSKQILVRLHQMTERYPQNVVFLQDYDVTIAGLMTKGCDVWMGNPQIPLEACSTSGMKAASNGLPNLSTPDGWWYRSCREGVNGWFVGEYYSKDYQNDARHLYDAIEYKVLPAFKDKFKWAHMMYASIYTALEECSTERMCMDYYVYIYNAPFNGF